MSRTSMTVDHAGSHHIANPVFQLMLAGYLFADAVSCSGQFNRENTDHLADAYFSGPSSVHTAVAPYVQLCMLHIATGLNRNLHERTEFHTETSIGAACICL